MMVAFNNIYPTTARANAQVPGAGVSAYRSGMGGGSAALMAPANVKVAGGVSNSANGSVDVAGSAILWVVLLAGAALLLMHAGVD